MCYHSKLRLFSCAHGQFVELKKAVATRLDGAINRVASLVFKGQQNAFVTDLGEFCKQYDRIKCCISTTDLF
jgi:hypothetical protein